MSELSKNALAILQEKCKTGKKRFSDTDLIRSGYSYQTAKIAINELEESGYIEVDYQSINHNFVLI